MGIYDDLIPKGASSSATADKPAAAPAAAQYGKFNELVPAKPAAAPTPAPSLWQSVKNFFTGAPAPAPAPVAPPVAAAGKFTDLIPKKESATAAAAPVTPPSPFKPEATKPLDTFKLAVSTAEAQSNPALKLAPDVFGSLKNAASTPQVAEKNAQTLTGVLLSIPKALIDSELHPSDAQLSFEKQVYDPSQHSTIGNIYNFLPQSLHKVVTRFFNPLLTPFAEDVSGAIVGNTPGQYGLTYQQLLELPAYKKTSAQIIGDTAQAVLAAYSPSVFGKSASAAVELGPKQALLSGARNGAEAGLFFGTGAAMSSGSTDPKEIAQIVFLNTTGGALLGGVLSGAIPVGKASIDSLTKDIITEYKLPQTVSISPAKIKDIFQTGQLISQSELDLVKSLGLSSKEYVQAIKNGLTIQIPTEAVVKMVDKPYWAKIKDAFSVAPAERILSRDSGKPTQAPAGLLEAGKPAPATDAGKFNDLVPAATEPAAQVGPAETLRQIAAAKPEAPAAEPSDVGIPEHVQEAAQQDWEQHYAEKVGILDHEQGALQAQLKATPKADLAPIQARIDQINRKLSAIEEEFTNRWRAQALNENIGGDATVPEKVANLEAQLREAYQPATLKAGRYEGMHALDSALHDVRAQFDLAEAGRRIIGDATHGGTETIGVPSTFPNWVPEHLRSRELFDKVMGFLDSHETLAYPAGNKTAQRALVNAVYDHIDNLTGVDTSAVRAKILSTYEQSTKQGKNARVGSRSSRGGEHADRGEPAKGSTRKGGRLEKPPATAEEAQQRYWDAKVAPAIKNGEPIILGADDLKDFFSNDYNIERHKLYSSATFEMYLRALKEVKNPVVKLTAGGPGAGKSDFLVGIEAENFNGIIYDSTGGNLEGLHKQIEAARAAGKEVKLYGIIPDLARARAYTHIREAAGQHPVTEASFIKNHVAAIKNLETLAKEGELVHILDTREMVTREQVMQASYEADPVAVLEKVAYSEVNVRDQIKGVTAETAKEIVGSRKENIPGGQEKAAIAPAKSGPSSVSGNFSVGEYSNGTPLTLGGADKIKIIELPEMVQLARELMGQVPKIRQKVSRAFGGEARGVFSPTGNGEIRLRADLFDPNVSDINQAAKTLAHEIGHLVDYLPDQTMSRGNLMGRLLTLKNFSKDFFTEAAGQTRTNKQLRTELWALSKEWKPIDEATASKSFLEYRKSAVEIYADFISVLFNDPKLAAERAPEAYNLFFELLDRKPQVRDAYFDAQSLLSGDRMTLIKARRTGVQQMFKEGDYKAIELQNERLAEREARNNNLLFKLKFELVDKNALLIDRVHQLEKKGVVINPDDNPVYYLEERNYLGGKIKAIMERDFNPVYQDLKAAGIDWGTFGEALFYQRIIAGDRSASANPRGITPEAAKELHDDLVAGLTGEQGTALEAAITQFRAGLRSVAEEAFKEGLYTPELYKQMQENPAYVTFQVIDHLEAGMSSKVYKSIGTLKDITNPADASILKMIATVRAIERNKVNTAAINFLNEHYPEEIETAKSSQGPNGKHFLDSRQPNQELVLHYVNGHAHGYYVDPYIKKSLDNESIGQSLAVVSGLKFANSHLFRPLFIGFNLGFQSFNLLRDFQRFYKNIPTMSFARALKLYGQSIPLAKARAFGGGSAEVQATLQMLEHDQVFATTFSDLIHGESTDETQIERILRQSGIDSFKPEVRYKALRPFVAVLDFITNLGNLIETLPKAAGYYEITKGGTVPLSKEDASYIRKNLGSPDFLAGGHIKPATNEIFLFSNAIAQGIRSDFQVATNPKTRAAYWWKTAKLNLIPKILMTAAALGFFGATQKKRMDDASEYDKTNYTIIPIGEDTTGRTIYFRMPQDETGRFFGGIFWKMLNFGRSGQPWTADLGNIASFMGGQAPSISPVITTIGAASEFISGQNPYDAFHGRNILSDDIFAAGGWRADKAFLGWVFQELGGGIFYRLTADGATPKEQGPAEKFFNLPVLGNIVGRFFRVTDYGQTERLKAAQAVVAGEEASARLDQKDVINKYIGQYQDDPNKGVNKRKIEVQMVTELLGHPNPQNADETTIARNAVDKFNAGLVRGAGDPALNALQSAGSNKQKAAILQTLKDQLTPTDYDALVQTAVKQHIISGDVVHSVK